MWALDKGAIPSCPPDLLKVVVHIGGMTNDNDIVDIWKVHANHQYIHHNDDSTTVRFLHQRLCFEVVIWPVEHIVCPELLTLNSDRETEFLL